MNDWTALDDAYAVTVDLGTSDSRSAIVARFAYEDDARAFLASLRRRKQSSQTYRLVALASTEA